MGYTYVDLIVRCRVSRNVRALVDMNSAYVVMDSRTTSEIGLHETPFEVELTLADKRKPRAKLYLAEVDVEGRRGPVFVAELDVPTPIMGAYMYIAILLLQWASLKGSGTFGCLRHSWQFTNVLGKSL